MTLRVARAADLVAHVGVALPASEAFAVSQDEIDRFVALSGDRQWIHCDVARAATELPGGRTIVPGNLLLALLPHRLLQVYAVVDFGRCLTAGYREIRFRQPVAVDTVLVLHADIRSVTSARRFVRVETQCRLIASGAEHSALTAIVTDLYYDTDETPPRLA
ncbi:MaoC/PaaZ C-terminal domain-containing protein [Bradyrhizobium sp. 2TAF24]|uniref:MaoC/PaaZ C-terminal domain-containing protein n=1 Tax=Bradyrhizobium sp. 2TAF24 TaxID=3233011 RepID=UPI003F8E58E4